MLGIFRIINGTAIFPLLIRNLAWGVSLLHERRCNLKATTRVGWLSEEETTARGGFCLDDDDELKTNPPTPCQ